MTVRVADYFEYYPVFPELWPFEYYEAENTGSQDDGEPVPGSRAYVTQVFEEYFRIPFWRMKRGSLYLTGILREIPPP